MPKHRRPHNWAIPLRGDWGRYELDNRVVPVVEAARPEVIVCLVGFRTSWPYTLATAREIVRTHNKLVKEQDGRATTTDEGGNAGSSRHYRTTARQIQAPEPRGCVGPKGCGQKP